MHRKSFVVALLTAGLMMVATAHPSFADKGGQGKGGGNSGKGSAQGNGNGGNGNPGKGNSAKGNSAKGNSAKGNSAKGNSGNQGGNASKGKGSQKKFESSQRSAIQDYYRDEYSRSGNCPPGLAKKNNGCLPPGQAKRNWDVGQPLPPDIEFYPLPPPLRATLVAPLPGYDYGYVDGGVVLFSTSNRIVVDFVIAY